MHWKRSRHGRGAAIVVYPDIYNHLVLATNYATQEEMKMYKSLEAHSFFTSGFAKRLAATQLP